MVTIDEAIAFLQEAKAKIGGDKVLILSLTNSELEDVNVDSLSLINDENSQYVEVKVKHDAFMSSDCVDVIIIR